MSTIEKWYAHFDAISLLLGAALGMFLGTWYSYFVKRPRLILIGNGGSGGAGLRTTSLNFINAPRFIGIQMPPSMLFGKQVHGVLRWGLPVDNLPARNLQATLFDKESGRVVSQLHWQRGPSFEPSIDLDSGEQAMLMVFSRLEQDPPHYFPFQPGPNGVGVNIPQTAGYTDESRKFEIRINYSQARKPLVLPCRVVRQFAGGFWVECRGGSTML